MGKKVAHTEKLMIGAARTSILCVHSISIMTVTMFTWDIDNVEETIG